MRGLKFSIPPKKLNYTDYLPNFELFYRRIYNLDSMSNENALTTIRNYNTNLPHNLSDEEFKALQNLSKNTNLVIQNS